MLAPILCSIVFVMGGIEELFSQVFTSQSFAQRTFPPPIFRKLRDKPSYAIRIPFSENGHSSFVPYLIFIPINMTVIWFNEDIGSPKVTSLPQIAHILCPINSIQISFYLMTDRLSKSLEKLEFTITMIR